MNNVENNYFKDGNRLVDGCFLQIKAFLVYSKLRGDKNHFTEQCFPAKMQAASLEFLCT